MSRSAERRRLRGRRRRETRATSATPVRRGRRTLRWPSRACRAEGEDSAWSGCRGTAGRVVRCHVRQRDARWPTSTSDRSRSGRHSPPSSPSDIGTASSECDCAPRGRRSDRWQSWSRAGCRTLLASSRPCIPSPTTIENTARQSCQLGKVAFSWRPSTACYGRRRPQWERYLKGVQGTVTQLQCSKHCHIEWQSCTKKTNFDDAHTAHEHSVWRTCLNSKHNKTKTAMYYLTTTVAWTCSCPSHNRATAWPNNNK